MEKNQGSRIRALLKLDRALLIKTANDLGIRKVGFKKRFKDSPEKDVKRSNEDIASLIYNKEIGN